MDEEIKVLKSLWPEDFKLTRGNLRGIDRENNQYNTPVAWIIAGHSVANIGRAVIDKLNEASEPHERIMGRNIGLMKKLQTDRAMDEGMAELLAECQQTFISLTYMDIYEYHNPSRIIELQKGGQQTLRSFLLNQPVSDTDEKHYLTHVDTIPPSQGKGLRLTCHSTTPETLQKKLKTIDNLFKDQLTPTSYQIITRTEENVRGSYTPHMTLAKSNNK